MVRRAGMYQIHARPFNVDIHNFAKPNLVHHLKSYRLCLQISLLTLHLWPNQQNDIYAQVFCHYTGV